MKKLLVLVLVLAFASLANATYMVTFGYPPTTITVWNDAPLLGGIDIGFGVIGDVTFSNFTYRTADAPWSTPIVVSYSAQDLIDAGEPFASLGYTGGWTTVTWGDPTLTPNGPGMWFTVNVTGTATQIFLTDGYGSTLFPLFIPEPITMALLGLGGLMIRRRK